MSAITFKDGLRAIRDNNARQFPNSFIVQFLDRWLEESADLSLWDKIADDAEKLSPTHNAELEIPNLMFGVTDERMLSRARVFLDIIRTACLCLELYSPKFGWIAAKGQFERNQQEINKYKNLAAYASTLAQYYRGLSEFFDTHSELQERVALYEKDAKIFLQKAAMRDPGIRFPRQRNSAKRDDAWAMAKVRAGSSD